MRRQGSQFTSIDFITVLATLKIKVSVDGRWSAYTPTA